ncbi:MAG: intradiol ring-cleavage dioxygenase [Acidimicrobiia bacterium]
MAPEHDHIEEPGASAAQPAFGDQTARRSGPGVDRRLRHRLGGDHNRGSGGSTTSSGATGTAAGGGTTLATFGGAGSCVLIPEETAGPYPLDLSGEEVFVRTDITEGGPGVPVALTLTLVNASADCAPTANARVDLWHCDADGVYSGYSQPGSDTTGETFCRGIQVSDSNGQVTFQTIHPGWYQGRITHIHFQAFLENGLVATSQIAFPPEITEAVYAVEPYAAKGPNSSVPTFADDNVFSDGTQYQMATVTGDAGSGYSATLLVGIAV